MKKAFTSLFLAQALLAPAFAFAQLTAGEQAFARKCHDNINAEKGQLSAATALECVQKLTDDDGELLTRLRNQSPEMGEAAADILAFNSALIDLKNIVTRNSGGDMAKHMVRVLEDSDCPLCAMGLGPRPEKTFDWVGKEAGSRLVEVQRAMRTWESLGEIRTGALSSGMYKYDLKRWNAQTIGKRYEALLEWASTETDRLVAVYGNRSGRAKRQKARLDPQLVSALREDLSVVGEDAQLAKLDQLVSDLDRMGDGKETAAPPPADKKAEELAVASKNIAGLKGKPESEQADYLNRTFDRTASKTGGVSKTGTAPAGPGAFVFKKLSPAQAAGLSGLLVTADAKGNLRGPLADELRGTKAGGEILDFYKDPGYSKAGSNRLNFAFTRKRKGLLGGWDPDSGTMNLSSEIVDDWMKKNQVRPEELFDGGPSGNRHLQKLSRYLAPSFVHESTHQRQSAKAGLAGAMMPYQMENETEAFAMDSSFIAEQLRKRGPSYASALAPCDKKNAERFLEEGVEGVRLSHHRGFYSHLESLEGSAAKEFAAAASTAKELRTLEEKYNTAPGTIGEAELARMRDLRASMDSGFKWYAMAYADSAAFEAKINGWRKEINGKLYPSRSVGAQAPPGLL